MLQSQRLQFLRLPSLRYFSSLTVSNERDHDLRLYVPVRMCLLNIDRRTDDCLCLHLCDLRVGDSQTAATMSHHRVELMQGVDDILDRLNGLVLCVCQLLDILFLSRYELMKRRIQETDRNRASLQCLVKLLKIALLLRKNLSPVLFLSLLPSQSRSSHGMRRYGCPQRTYARYGKGRYPLRQAHVPFLHHAGYLRWYEPSWCGICLPMPMIRAELACDRLRLRSG